MRNVLVSGASGYLGSCLVEALKDRCDQIVRLGRPGGSLSPVQGKALIKDVHGDIGGFEAWLEALDGVDTVFHLAAQTSSSLSNEKPVEDFQLNLRPMLQLLEVCRRQGWVPAVLFAGTVTQRGLPDVLPVSESDVDEPVTIYDIHKLTAETYLGYYTRSDAVAGVTLRLANVYGPGPASSRPDRGVLNQMVRRALEGGALTVYGRGEALRDYVYVGDVVEAFLKAAEHIESVRGNPFVIGSGRGHSIAEAIHMVAAQVEVRTGRPVQVTHTHPSTPQTSIETRSFVADTGRFRALTGWEPRCSLAAGISRTIDYWLERLGK